MSLGASLFLAGDFEGFCGLGCSSFGYGAAGSVSVMTTAFKPPGQGSWQEKERNKAGLTQAGLDPGLIRFIRRGPRPFGWSPSKASSPEPAKKPQR